MNPPTLPNRLWPFSFHFYRQFTWGCLGLVVFPVLSRGIFASIPYAIKRLTDTVLSMHNPAAEAGKLRTAREKPRDTAGDKGTKVTSGGGCIE